MMMMFCLAFLGLCALGLSLSRHHADVRGTFPTPVQERNWRIAGWLLLVLSLTSLLPRAVAAIAVVEWFALLMAAALFVVAFFTWRPRWLPVAAGLCVLGILAALGIGLLSGTLERHSGG